ncbi:MAG: hypothetical protein IKZ50_07075 [Bacteroidales bacterium]|nr:hypothetical protein [Bacteroidales bacterium]
MATKSKRSVGSEKEKDSTQYYYEMARKARAEALAIADTFKGNPQRFRIHNVIFMDVEVSKQDIKTIVSKDTGDAKFNFIKNEAAKDIKGFLEKAIYEGWAEVIKGKHPESAFFVYYSKRSRRKMTLCVRKIIDIQRFKPYAIIPYIKLKKRLKEIKKGIPL